ncbi:MAG: YjbH domain-containing protein [candidate division WOR-3 bacterium]|nr:YjbH domain-containing protein [candidate division WOR-3 bacterium]
MVVALLISFGILSQVPAPSFYGTTGLVKIPTAEVAEYGKVVIGGGYTDDYFYQSKKTPEDWSLFATIGFIPRLEIGLRMGNRTFFPKVTIDRMISAKCLLVKESHSIPAIALGGQDIIGEEKHFNSLYMVSSKNLGFLGVERIRVHFGWGTDWLDFITGKAKAYRFIGAFGGIDVKVFPFLALLAEYDAEDINLGVRFSVKRILNVTFNLTAMKELGCVASLTFTI